jgi:hypothetical protein
MNKIKHLPFYLATGLFLLLVFGKIFRENFKEGISVNVACKDIPVDQCTQRSDCKVFGGSRYSPTRYCGTKTSSNSNVGQNLVAGQQER